MQDDLNVQTEIDRYTFRSPAQAIAYHPVLRRVLLSVADVICFFYGFIQTTTRSVFAA